MKGSCDRSVWLKLSLKKEMFLHERRNTCERLDLLDGDRS